ncbi:MAG: DUF2277 family protein [Dehalococcoidia bacterium]|nr:MAG: DUF2277 family protein [Dehalococcoidia bacterium]
MRQESYREVRRGTSTQLCHWLTSTVNAEVSQVSGYQRPAPANAPAFDAAVEDVAAVTHRLLAALPKP